MALACMYIIQRCPRAQRQCFLDEIGPRCALRSEAPSPVRSSMVVPIKYYATSGREYATCDVTSTSTWMRHTEYEPRFLYVTLVQTHGATLAQDSVGTCPCHSTCPIIPDPGRTLSLDRYCCITELPTFIQKTLDGHPDRCSPYQMHIATLSLRIYNKTREREKYIPYQNC